MIMNYLIVFRNSVRSRIPALSFYLIWCKPSHRWNVKLNKCIRLTSHMLKILFFQKLPSILLGDYYTFISIWTLSVPRIAIQKQTSSWILCMSLFINFYITYGSKSKKNLIKLTNLRAILKHNVNRDHQSYVHFGVLGLLKDDNNSLLLNINNFTHYNQTQHTIASIWNTTEGLRGVGYSKFSFIWLNIWTSQF